MTGSGRGPAGEQRPAASGGFTLIELIVVISIIILVVTIVVPTVGSLLTSGGAAQTHNIFAAQLMAARALAISEGTHAAVHQQVSAPEQFRSDHVFFTAVMWVDPSVDRGAQSPAAFSLAPGYKPQRLPRPMAFGEVSYAYASDSGQGPHFSEPQSNSPAHISDFIRSFTWVTIVFSPRGDVVTEVDPTDLGVYFDAQDELFHYETTGPGDDGRALWDSRFVDITLFPGATAVTQFDVAEFAALRSGWGPYLDERGQFLPINVYTGRLLDQQ